MVYGPVPRSLGVADDDGWWWQTTRTADEDGGVKIAVKQHTNVT